MRHLGSRLAIVGFPLLAGLIGCASDSRPDPRDTVKEFFAAIRASDTLYLSQHLDMHRAIGTLGEDLAMDSGSSDPTTSLLAALTGEGKIRERWLDNQIVIGRAQSSADTAWVEVSFIDRLTRVQYYNKMRLDYRSDRWVINSFKTL